MNGNRLIKVAIVVTAFLTGLIGFAFSPKSQIQTMNSAKTSKTVINGKDEVAGYKNWTKASKSNFVMNTASATACAATRREVPIKGSEIEKSPHKDKYINVFVNAVGKEAMLMQKRPKFPVGTVIVKEKLSSPDSLIPELLTVMIKRAKGFNPKVGDWEFMTLNGDATEVTSKGKLENCQTCHIGYKQNDFITRTYLTDAIKERLK